MKIHLTGIIMNKIWIHYGQKKGKIMLINYQLELYDYNINKAK